MGRLAIIAGGGALPRRLAEHAKASGRDLFVQQEILESRPKGRAHLIAECWNVFALPKGTERSRSSVYLFQTFD